MIKLVVSDIDGTLLPYGETKLSGEIFSLIEQLKERGIPFCPTSGRQYHSIRSLFPHIADELSYVCENGGVLYKDDVCIGKTPMPRAMAEKIARDLWERSEGEGEVMLSGENTSYLMERGLGMTDRIRFIGNHYCSIQDPAQIPEDIVKVSVYLEDGVDAYVDRFVPRWRQANAAVAGPKWIDTTFANKGIGVRAICRELGIGLEEVMAFGDNYNDVSMLDAVGVPCLMQTAAQELLERYPNHTPCPEDTIQTLLDSLKD